MTTRLAWQAKARTQTQPLAKYLLMLALIFLSACSAVDFATPRDGVAPPNFTRGLLLRNSASPLYPLRAENLGIEGWVMLRFSVSEGGQVMANTIEILDEQPGTYFERSATTAARRLTFENTRGEVVEDVRYVFRYELEDKTMRFRSSTATQEMQFRELIPRRYITPNYPAGALSQGVEGYVTVEFTVTEAGTVREIVINESQPSGVFDVEAIAAATRLRFEPRLEFGNAVAVEKVLYRFDWNLPKD